MAAGNESAVGVGAKSAKNEMHPTTTRVVDAIAKVIVTAGTVLYGGIILHHIQLGVSPTLPLLQAACVIPIAITLFKGSPWARCWSVVGAGTLNTFVIVLHYGFTPVITALPAIVTVVLVVAYEWRGVWIGAVLFILSMLVAAALITSGTVPPPERVLMDPLRWSVWLRVSASAAVALTVIGALAAWLLISERRSSAALREALERGFREHRERVEAETRELKIKARLADAERFELAGKLAAGIAHDVNNAITVVLGAASELELEPLSASGREAIRDIGEAAQLAANTTSHVLASVRKAVSAPRATAVHELARRTVPAIRRLLPAEVDLVTDISGEARALVDPTQFQRALLNLVSNAADSMPHGGCVRFSVWDSEKAVNVRVADEGVGMEESIQQKVFEPFFTTKAKHGTGLGLDMVRRFVDGVGGRVELSSKVGEGTTVTLLLPRETEEGAEGHAREAGRAQLLAEHSVLVVEDEPAVRKLLVRAFRQMGVGEIKEAADAEDGISKLDGTLTLLCTDAVVPGPTSIAELLQQARSRYPKLQVLVVSGHVEEELIRRGITSGSYLFIRKPFLPGELKVAMFDALGGGKAPRDGAGRAGD